MCKKLVLIFTAIISVFLLTVLSANSTPARAETEGDYTYTVTDGEATITGFTNYSYSGALTIPSTLGGYPVVAIYSPLSSDYRAFKYCDKITSVVK